MEPTPTSDAPTPAPGPTTAGTALYLLLDRSGSMATIADDVVGGVNRFLRDQQADGDDAVVTIVLFDGEDPEEVLADAVPVTDVAPLSAATFVPRGSTPLLDATARIVARARAREAYRAAEDLPPEDVVVVSVTDGHENTSREVTLGQVRALVDERSRAGWNFVFLSAALDVYGEAGGLGYDHRSTQAFAADALGTATAFESLSQSAANMRRKVRLGELRDTGDFFEGGKPAEERRRRDGT